MFSWGDIVAVWPRLIYRVSQCFQGEYNGGLLVRTRAQGPNNLICRDLSAISCFLGHAVPPPTPSAIKCPSDSLSSSVFYSPSRSLLPLPIRLFPFSQWNIYVFHVTTLQIFRDKVCEFYLNKRYFCYCLSWLFYSVSRLVLRILFSSLISRNSNPGWTCLDIRIRFGNSRDLISRVFLASLTFVTLPVRGLTL